MKVFFKRFLLMFITYNTQVHLAEWQHLTMFLSFFVSGVVDIISQKVVPKRLISLEKACTALAFVITSLLLFYHKHGKVSFIRDIL